MTVTAVVMKADFQRWSRCDMMQTVTKVSRDSHPLHFIDGEINELYALMITNEWTTS